MRLRTRVKGLGAFGQDPAIYDRIRPDYAPELLALLPTVCAVPQAARIVEIGPGTGQMTRGLLALNPLEIMAYEPDPELADFLAKRHADSAALRVLPQPFEAARLAPQHYDLAVAATSFHWLNAKNTLASIKRALKPGGWWLACWHIFNDPWVMEDPFRMATAPVFAAVGRVQQDDCKGLFAFGLDSELRTAELRGAGFSEIRHAVLRQLIALDTEGVLALYATFSPVTTLNVEARAHFLGQLRHVVDTQFGGRVVRPLLTPYYLAQRPS